MFSIFQHVELFSKFFHFPVILFKNQTLVMGRVYPNPKTRPEPEAFSPTRSNPNPKFSQFHKPETTRTRTFQDFKNPKLPEPEIKTRGYPTGLKLHQISPRNLKIIQNICTNFMPNLTLHQFLHASTFTSITDDLISKSK